MSEVKPMIKTVDQRLNGVAFSGNRTEVSAEEFVALTEEAAELRAAIEALQKENNSLKLGYKAKEVILQEAQKEVAKLRSFDADNKGLKECNAILTDENAAQAKRIAELEQQLHDRTITSGAKIHEQARCISEAIAWIEILRDSFLIEKFPTMRAELEAFILNQKGIEL